VEKIKIHICQNNNAICSQYRKSQHSVILSPQFITYHCCNVGCAKVREDPKQQLKMSLLHFTFILLTACVAVETDMIVKLQTSAISQLLLKHRSHVLLSLEGMVVTILFSF